jgi:hypothetical protein
MNIQSQGNFNDWILPLGRIDSGEEYHVIEDADHFSICKPPNREHPSYFRLRNFISSILEKVRMFKLCFFVLLCLSLSLSFSLNKLIVVLCLIHPAPR